MGRYSQLSGKRVEAHYRAGDIYLSAHGTLIVETENAVFIEERFTHNGKGKNHPCGHPLRIPDSSH